VEALKRRGTYDPTGYLAVGTMRFFKVALLVGRPQRVVAPRLTPGYVANELDARMISADWPGGPAGEHPLDSSSWIIDRRILLAAQGNHVRRLLGGDACFLMPPVLANLGPHPAPCGQAPSRRSRSDVQTAFTRRTQGEPRE
jgi:hypothetical protein